MRKIILTPEQMLKIKDLKEAGASWLKIQRGTGVGRRIAKTNYEEFIKTKVVRINFEVEARWKDKQLFIVCPSAAARDFITRALEDSEIVVQVRQ